MSEDKNSQSPIGLGLLWDEIYENPFHACYPAQNAKLVTVKEENGKLKLEYRKSQPIKVLSLIGMELIDSCFEDIIDTGSGETTAEFNSFSGTLIQGCFREVKASGNVTKYSNLRYEQLLNYIVQDVPKQIKNQGIFLQNIVGNTYAFWKWGKTGSKKKLSRISSVEKKELETFADQALVKEIIEVIESRYPHCIGLPKEWKRPYELLAGIVLLTVVSVPFVGRDGKAIINCEIVRENQEKIKEATFKYFQDEDQENSLDNSDLLNLWTEKMKAAIQWCEQMAVDVPEINDLGGINLHVNLKWYTKHVNELYVYALVNDLPDEMESIMELIRDEIANQIPRLLTKLAELRVSAERQKNNPEIMEVFVNGMNEAVEKTFSIGSKKTTIGGMSSEIIS